jgi:signal transduction histidine kinase
MAGFALTNAQEADADRMPTGDRLGSTVLVHNIRWFIRIRWVVVIALIMAAIISHFVPVIVTALVLLPPDKWPWVVAAFLAAANLLFWVLSHRLTAFSPDRFVRGNLWLQIVVDLVIVTILVHFVGSTTTFVSFIYLFHVVLACIFFSPSQSFLVTLLAAGLYLLCVDMEILSVWPATGISPLAANGIVSRQLSGVYAASAVIIWLTVWYLVATLSKIVRERDRLLESANQRLIAADQEKNRIVLRTTHDLKAPFSGMESNIQVLKTQYWNQIPDAVRDIVNRIEIRGRTLSDRIRDILLLGDLRTPQVIASDTFDLSGLLRGVVEEVNDKAQERGIAIHLDSAPVKAVGRPRYFSILFSNLIANSISYSHEHGNVEISVCSDSTDVHVLVKDHGIGIAEEFLPRIFDEYFRTKEALRVNPGSTGLGLAIVKEIVHMEGLKISVISEVGEGTAFDVAIPASRCEFSKETMPCRRS